MARPWRGVKEPEEAAAPVAQASAITLQQMVFLCEKTLEADKQVEDLKAELARASERARRLHEETIPGAMAELQVKELTLDGGWKITCDQDVYCSVAGEGKAAAIDWLEDNDLGGLVKTVVGVAFGKGEMEKAIKLLDSLNAKKGIVATLDRDVNAQTLKATLRDYIRKGKPFPLDLFKARPVWVAKVKQK